MTTAVRPDARTAAARTTTDEALPTDVLVVFGITGDLAKQMTSWGPREADRLLAGHGRWHEPWVGS
jgi:hypothetical protein